MEGLERWLVEGLVRWLVECLVKWLVEGLVKWQEVAWLLAVHKGGVPRAGYKLVQPTCTFVGLVMNPYSQHLALSGWLLCMKWCSQHLPLDGYELVQPTFTFGWL